MDIEQVLKEKEQLEKDIKKLILDYGKRTHTRVTDINIQEIVAYDETHVDRYITTGLSLRLTVEI